MQPSDTIRALTRRSFLACAATGASAWTAANLFGAPDSTSTKPNAALEKMGAVALAQAKKQGATYADLRMKPAKSKSGNAKALHGKQ